MLQREVRRAERARRRAIRENPYGREAVEQAIADGCVLDEVRGFDPETNEWVYSVACLAEAHARIPRCPTEHEMFRKRRGA